MARSCSGGCAPSPPTSLPALWWLAPLIQTALTRLHMSGWGGGPVPPGLTLRPWAKLLQRTVGSRDAPSLAIQFSQAMLWVWLKGQQPLGDRGPQCRGMVCFTAPVTLGKGSRTAAGLWFPSLGPLRRRADPAQVPSDPQVLPAYSTTCVPQAMLPWATGQSGLFLTQPGYTTALRSKSGKVTVPALVLHGSAEVQGKDKGLWGPWGQAGATWLPAPH